jgi:hypothetical protein
MKHMAHITPIAFELNYDSSFCSLSGNHQTVFRSEASGSVEVHIASIEFCERIKIGHKLHVFRKIS